MFRFSWRYALRNAIHYRAKYAIAFGLIAAFSACLALSLFAFNGFWSQAGVYARSWGDMTIYVNVQALEAKADPQPGPGEPSSWERVQAALPEFLEERLGVTAYHSTSVTRGSAYFKSGNEEMAAMDAEKAERIWGVDLAEGRMPGEGEALVPVIMRKSVALGDPITFVFKNRDTILNSFQFRITGFYLPSGMHDNLLYLSGDQYASLDPGRPDDIYLLFLAHGGVRGSFPPKAEYKAIHNYFRKFVADHVGNEAAWTSGYGTAADRYKGSKSIIDFFQLLFGIFLVAIVVVAIATLVNVVLITLIDRIKIVGTFMAYGMRRRRAILLLATETLAFALAACTLGVLAALAATGPLCSLRFLADNWTIAVILGGKRTLTILPSLWAVAATYAAGAGIPFAASALAASRMLKGDVVRLLHFVK